jgi:MOSC domain-containing protein YiiM
MSDEAVGRITGLQRSAGGVPKRPVDSASVQTNGMTGDRQRNLRFHGGPDRALCLYSQELIEALAAEGHPIFPGAVGENVTIAGLPWDRVQPGARLTLGDVEVEVTAYTTPCRTIAAAFRDERSTRISQIKHPGWSRVYARILRTGALRVGDRVTLHGAVGTARASNDA